MILKLDLKDVIILDNTPSVFSLQKNNGLPITSFLGESSDN